MINSDDIILPCIAGTSITIMLASTTVVAGPAVALLLGVIGSGVFAATKPSV